VNSGAPWSTPKVAEVRVLGIQRKLHQWASDDPNRRFSDLQNLVCDPSTLMVAWLRVRSNRGSRSAGVDGKLPATSNSRWAWRSSLTGFARSCAQGASGPFRSRSG
jgi:hypothetical protein